MKIDININIKQITYGITGESPRFSLFKDLALYSIFNLTVYPYILVPLSVERYECFEMLVTSYNICIQHKT